MNHINHIVQDLPLNYTKEVPEIHKNFCNTKKGVKHTFWCWPKP